jgi:hypothetical protein
MITKWPLLLMCRALFWLFVRHCDGARCAEERAKSMPDPTYPLGRLKNWNALDTTGTKDDEAMQNVRNAEGRFEGIRRIHKPERPVMSYAAHQREIDKDDLRRQIHALVQGSINSAERVIDIDLIEKFK